MARTSELADSMALLAHLPTNVLIQFPSGRWGFVGHVDARLCYTSPDGGNADPAEIAKARSFGPALAKIKRRSWDTATEAAAALGFTVE